MNKAVFLDRDGTINVEKNYLYKISDFEFIPGAVEAIKLLKDRMYKVIIVSNQAGIARGYYTERDVDRLHEWMVSELKKKGVVIDDIYYCPHHEEYGLDEYKVDCSCRKPKTGMFTQGMQRFNINPAESYTIGDRESDLIAGKSAGTKTILVKTGYGQTVGNIYADYICSDLLEAVREIVV